MTGTEGDEMSGPTRPTAEECKRELEIMQIICDPSARAQYERRPFGLHGRTYATDGKILLCIQGEHEESCDCPPGIESILPPVEMVIDGAWPYPQVSPEVVACESCGGTGRERNPCGQCDGMGRCECECGHEHECGQCDGTGRGDAPTCCEDCGGLGKCALYESVKIGGVNLDTYYVEILNHIPGLMFGVSDARERDNAKKIYVRSDLVCGAVMGLMDHRHRMHRIGGRHA